MFFAFVFGSSFWFWRFYIKLWNLLDLFTFIIISNNIIGDFYWKYSLKYLSVIKYTIILKFEFFKFSILVYFWFDLSYIQIGPIHNDFFLNPIIFLFLQAFFKPELFVFNKLFSKMLKTKSFYVPWFNLFNILYNFLFLLMFHIEQINRHKTFWKYDFIFLRAKHMVKLLAFHLFVGKFTLFNQNFIFEKNRFVTEMQYPSFEPQR